MRLADALTIGDLRRLARRRLPRLVFDYIDGGAEDEDGLRRNREAFRRHRLLPRYLVDIARRDQSVELFGRRYASPFGIGPTGLNGFARPGADGMLAEAAAEADIPFVLSGAGTASIEDMARAAPRHCWYQLYVARERKITEDIVRRARDSGIGVLMLTVDVPVHSKRERDRRNGFVLPPRPSAGAFFEAMTHPGWLASLARHGRPRFETWAPYAGERASANETAAYFASQIPFAPTWADLDSLRRLWPGKLVIKGIMNPDDARRAADAGVDGIVVSNHGGRQLDRAPSALEAFPAIREAIGDRIVLMLDGGVQRGADIVVALALGARFVFVGRATLFGVAVAGAAGARRAIAILRDEIDITLGQIGCPQASALGPEALAPLYE